MRRFQTVAPTDKKRKARVTHEEQLELQQLGLSVPANDRKEDSTSPAVAPRVVHLNPGPDVTLRKFASNSVHTAKYNVITFLPRYLFEQFSQVAYFYFLTQASLVWWSTVSPFKPFGPVLALSFVLVVGAIKAIAEDRRRHVEDDTLNNSIAHVLQEDGSTTDVKWRNVKVGDLLKVVEDEDIPADLVCLYCALDDNICYIKTTGLDGETNLKVRRPIDAKVAAPVSVAEAIKMKATVACEPPNSNLHYFMGRCVILTGEEKQTVAITMNDVLLRGCTLKNSGFVVGLVVYTGPESRIQMNSAAPPRKQGSYTAFLNMQVGIIIILQLLLCALCSMGALIWREQKGRARYYLALDNSAQGNYSSNIAFFFVNLVTFWLLFSYLVPISLFVTLEVVKFIQGNFINADPEMKPAESTEWAKARNTNIIEDLGRVSYVFSDKTGTLTSNDMRMRAVALQGIPHGSLDFRLEEFEGSSDEALKAFASSLHSETAALKCSGLWNELLMRGGTPARVPNVPGRTAGMSSNAHAVATGRLIDFWTAICVCHNLIVEGASPATSAATSPAVSPYTSPEGPPALSLAGPSDPGPLGTDAGFAAASGPSIFSAAKSQAGPGQYAEQADPSESAVSAAVGEMARDQNGSRVHLSAVSVPLFESDGLPKRASTSSSTKPQKHTKYQGPSPDEVALVEGARQLGFEFVSRAHRNITITFQGQEVTHEVLVELEFTSERARMSVVSRAPDGTIRLLCKGSDAVMLKRLRADTDPQLIEATQENLLAFSIKGLRNLVIATKVLTEDHWSTWFDTYSAAASSLENRNALIAAAAEQLEVDLDLLGVTAIEDKLQEGVPEAIETLIQGGMKVWMITGDKQETAINIAVSAGLVSDASRCLICNASGVDAARGLLTELQQQLQKHVETGEGRSSGWGFFNNADRRLAHPSSRANVNKEVDRSEDLESQIRHSSTTRAPPLVRKPELVVDGSTLEFILGTPAEAQLASIAAACSSVVVCRASPSQKAAVVRMMRRHELLVAQEGSCGKVGRWVRRRRRLLGNKMLSIGDGANDVAMIQTADIGVGIMGKEGRQAVNNSDFAISQFRFLVRLLIVHGSLATYRLSRLIRYSFYKNITLAFLLFFYQGFAGWSGQTLLDGITTSFYNAFFTAIPIAAFAVVDRPFRNLTTYIRFPQMYNVNNPLTTRTFWKTGIAMAICHAATIFFIVYYGTVISGQNSIHDVYAEGKIMFVALVTVVTAEILMLARFWTKEFIIIVALSYASIYAFLFILPALQMAFKSPDPTTYGMGQMVFSRPLFWLELIIITFICTGSRYLDRALRQAFYPNDQQIVAEAEKLPHGGAPSTATRLHRLSSISTEEPFRRMSPVRPHRKTRFSKTTSMTKAPFKVPQESALV